MVWPGAAGCAICQGEGTEKGGKRRRGGLTGKLTEKDLSFGKNVSYIINFVIDLE